MICDVVGFDGELALDTTKPDGTPRKLLDVSKLHGLGWQPAISLRDGIARTYDWFFEECGSLKALCAMSKLRVGVVGVGHIGRNHARLYTEMPGAEFTAMYDVDPVRGDADRQGIWRNSGGIAG